MHTPPLRPLTGHMCIKTQKIRGMPTWPLLGIPTRYHCTWTTDRLGHEKEPQERDEEEAANDHVGRRDHENHVVRDLRVCVCVSVAWRAERVRTRPPCACCARVHTCPEP